MWNGNRGESGNEYVLYVGEDNWIVWRTGKIWHVGFASVKGKGLVDDAYLRFLGATQGGYATVREAKQAVEDFMKSIDYRPSNPFRLFDSLMIALGVAWEGHRTANGTVYQLVYGINCYVVYRLHQRWTARLRGEHTEYGKYLPIFDHDFQTAREAKQAVEDFVR